MFVQLAKKFYSLAWELGVPSKYNDLAMDWKIWRVMSGTRDISRLVLSPPSLPFNGHRLLFPQNKASVV